MTRRAGHAWLWVLALALLLSGCAGVTVSSVSPAQYLAERRGDALTTGRLSEAAQEVLRVVGIDDCRDYTQACRDTLVHAQGLSDEQRMATQAELWVEAGLAADREAAQGGSDALAFDAWLQAARHAYAYLFFTERQPGRRAFEDRQTQVRDYYNYAVQRTFTRLFQRVRSHRQQEHQPPTQLAGWTLQYLRGDFAPRAVERLPEELLAAASLRFTGVRNTYRRDGFGAEMVAVLAPEQAGQVGHGAAAGPGATMPFEQLLYPNFTALLRFPGDTLAEVLATRQVQLSLYDPYRYTQVPLAGETVPLAANFTAGYGLWLARSGFAVQSLRTLFGLSDGLVRPRIHLMQPYDPARRTIVMLHGLASSPEAWINVANEVLGDETLRRNYQIWQVYYPTNAPLALNLHAIREALQQTLHELDPGGQAQASRDMVLVGHSMGGVLSRLLVSSSGNRLWAATPAVSGRAGAARDVRQRLAPYLTFEPLAQVSTAIFIAAPHRGTPFAGNRLVRRVANLITLPLAMLEQIGELGGLFPGDAAQVGPRRIPNSIDNLRDTDPFVQAAADLPLAPRVRYHSIIGQAEAELPLAQSSDGIVPYTSAHLAGATSELVLPSEHSVQEQPQAILEIRRILRERLED